MSNEYDTGTQDETIDGGEETSSIMAALVRTSTRAVQQLFRGGSKAVAIGRVPVRQVAKLADKSSQVLDLVDSSPSFSDMKKELNEFGIKGMLRQVRSFFVGIAKSGIAGIIVFGKCCWLVGRCIIIFIAFTLDRLFVYKGGSKRNETADIH